MLLNVKQLDRICLITMVIVSLVCGYLVVNAGARQKRKINYENTLLSKKLEDLNLAETNLQRLNNILDKTKKELQYLNDRIPDTARIGEFFNQLDVFMKEREIALISVQPLPCIQDELYTKIPILLTFESSFVKLYGLLHDLEAMKREVTMEKIDINKSGMTKGCRVVLTLNIFER